MTSFEIEVQGPYTLNESAAFLCGFTPASGTSSAERGGLRLGFLQEGRYTPTVVELSQQRSRVIVRCAERREEAETAKQVARMLSLDHDASGLEKVAARDVVVAAALAERPGFRPVCFASAYEAALWGVLSQRTPMRVAAQLKRRLAERTGSVVQAWGQEFTLAPPPERLLSLRQLGGVPQHKLERLQNIAQAALVGALDTERLRCQARASALAELRSLPGVGPWTAELILMRGSGVKDELTETEPRVFDAVGDAYGLGRAATGAELAKISDGWRPFRTWMSVLFVSQAMRAAPGLSARPSRLRRGAVASPTRMP